jgi:hypothetical protein
MSAATAVAATATIAAGRVSTGSSVKYRMPVMVIVSTAATAMSGSSR